MEEVRKIREEYVGDDELELAKDTYINQFIFKFTSSASIVGQMVGIEYEGLPLDYLDTYVDNIKDNYQKRYSSCGKRVFTS